MTVPASDRAFFAIAALIFVVSAAVTILWCSFMSAMGGMPMPGGWAMSMTWMRMGGESWLGAASTFLGMWTVMMVAMMLPVVMPMLRRYRRAIGQHEARLGRLTALVGVGYFALWIAIGLVVFPLGVVLAEGLMRQEALSHAVPITAGVVVLIAGALQFTPSKAHRLACCNEPPGRDRLLPTSAVAAWRYGLHLGAQCSLCCANLVAIMLALGVMDLRVMAAVTAAITLERLAPAVWRVAQVIGIFAIGAGLLLMVMQPT